MIEDKPDPYQILQAIKDEEKKGSFGKLKIFFGMAAGVGKTYCMLQEAHERLAEGTEVVVATINTHGRAETEKILEGLPILPEKWIEFKDKAFRELDLDKILETRPQLVLIDELAHTNVPGSKHPKRWQDVVEILDAGIDVYTTLNVQHLESRKDIVENVTGIQVFETVPDLILERASAIEIIDIPPAELLQRLKEGKVYLGDQSLIAAQNFFKEDNLTALREIALRFTAEKVDHDLHGILAIGKGWKTRERLMVAISHSPTSQQLIRSARRLAFELDAPWVAVWVDNGVKLSSEDQLRLSRNLQLAKDLGAETLTIYDIDIANALQSAAKQKSITRLVIGRPTKRSFFQKVFHKQSLIDRLAEENKQLDILIFRQDKLISLYQQALPFFRVKSNLYAYWTSLGIVALTTVVGYFLEPFIGYKTVGDLFLAVILILSLFFGLGPVLLAAALSALSWDFLFIPPTLNFFIHDPADFLHLVFYFITAIVVGILNTRIREYDQFLFKRKEKIENLYEVMKEIAKSTNFQYLRLNVGGKLKALFGGEFDILIKGIDRELIFDSSLPILSEQTDHAAAIWCAEKGKETGFSTDTLPSAKGFYVPIKFSNTPIGLLIFYSKTPHTLSIDEKNFLQTVADQLGIYLERYVFEERVQNQNYLRQVEKLHAAIFRSLTKGFYAPLEKIQTFAQKLKQIARNKEETDLAEQMDDSSKNLKMIVENILMISQLESGFIEFEKGKHSIKKLIDEVIAESASFTEEHPLKVHLPSNDLMIDCDFKLLKIALKNVLINAAEYSPPKSPIEIEVKPTDNEFKISVLDEGPGIPKEYLPFIFEKFYRVPGAKFEGIGLGLSIVRSIIELHNGKLEVINREKQGTEFSLILSL